MKKLQMFAIGFAGAALAVEGCAAEKMAVVIIDRQDSQSTYSYVIPGRSITTSQASADCSSVASRVNCSGAGDSTTLATPSVEREFTVSGSTLALQLTDGRVVVVNCGSKPKMNYNNLAQRTVRSCRVPITNSITAEFDGERQAHMAGWDRREEDGVGNLQNHHYHRSGKGGEGEVSREP